MVVWRQFSRRQRVNRRDVERRTTDDRRDRHRVMGKTEGERTFPERGSDERGIDAPRRRAKIGPTADGARGRALRFAAPIRISLVFERDVAGRPHAQDEPSGPDQGHENLKQQGKPHQWVTG